MKSVKLEREYWVDMVKVIACVLVVIGHFFQSMVGAELILASGIYKWFVKTIYYFHVPLFFICSGYLYQKGRPINSFVTWKENICKKLIVLGVPYFTFSIITWSLKNVFSSSVNTETDGLLSSLFQHPLSPYWYLYILFLCF